MSKSSKKRPYRAIRLSRVEVNDVLDQVKGQRVVIGVDVAKTKMVLAVMDESGQVVVTVRWSHPVETESLVGFLEELREVAQEVSVAMEPSGVYGDALRWRLLGAGFEVFRVSAKKSHDMAEIYDGVASSHDAKSAAIVAELHASDRSTPWPQESKRHRELSAALRLVEVFGKQARQNTNRLEALSARHWPELTSILDLGTATLLELLMSFGGPQSVAQDREEAGDLMRRVGGSKLAPEKVEAVLGECPRLLGAPHDPRRRAFGPHSRKRDATKPIGVEESSATGGSACAKGTHDKEALGGRGENYGRGSLCWSWRSTKFRIPSVSGQGSGLESTGTK